MGSWDVEYTDTFGQWWDTLTEEQQDSVAHYVELLESQGPRLRFPYSTRVTRSKHPRMRELRIQHRGRPHRVLYAFDRRRVAVLLIGGEKTGKDLAGLGLKGPRDG